MAKNNRWDDEQDALLRKYWSNHDPRLSAGSFDKVYSQPRFLNRTAAALRHRRSVLGLVREKPKQFARPKAEYKLSHVTREPSVVAETVYEFDTQKEYEKHVNDMATLERLRPRYPNTPEGEVRFRADVEKAMRKSVAHYRKLKVLSFLRALAIFLAAAFAAFMLTGLLLA